MRSRASTVSAGRTSRSTIGTLHRWQALTKRGSSSLPIISEAMVTCSHSSIACSVSRLYLDARSCRFPRRAIQGVLTVPTRGPTRASRCSSPPIPEVLPRMRRALRLRSGLQSVLRSLSTRAIRRVTWWSCLAACDAPTSTPMLYASRGFPAWSQGGPSLAARRKCALRCGSRRSLRTPKIPKPFSRCFRVRSSRSPQTTSSTFRRASTSCAAFPAAVRSIPVCRCALPLKTNRRSRPVSALRYER